MKRVEERANQFNALREFNIPYDSNTYMITGDLNSESLISEALFNFTNVNIERFGKVNTHIYNPLTDTFYGINDHLENPNGFFYTAHHLDNHFVKEFTIESIFIQEENGNQQVNNAFSSIIQSIKDSLLSSKKHWKFNITNKDDVKQFYLRVNVDLKTRTFEYYEISFISVQNLQLKYPNKDDEYDRNLFFLNSCGNDYYNNNPICKFTKFSKRGESGSLVELSTLRFQHPLPVYLQRLKGSGTHLDTEITNFNFNITTDHLPYTIYTVPQGIFIDKYQLEEISRKSNEFILYMYEPMDLEAPIATGRQAHVILHYLKPQQHISFVLFFFYKLPIHLRYHKARSNDLYEENVIFPPPQLFFTCINCTDARSIESLRNNNSNGYINTPISCSVDDPIQYLNPTCGPQFSVYKVPVGQLNYFDTVSLITLGTTVVGAIVVLFFTIFF
ncbi:Phosphatidylinositol-glycan biosynthesis class X protein [Entamoeba marina]